MPRYIDADEAYKVLTDYYHIRTELQHKALKEAMERVPTVDAVEVVRCKDCEWRNCLRCYHKRSGMDDLVGENDYCSWGKRREDVR